jgi:hypothetical protein
VDDALAPAWNLIEQPAEAIAETGDETVGQQRKKFQQPDRELCAIAAQHAASGKGAWRVTGFRKAEKLT